LFTVSVWVAGVYPVTLAVIAAVWFAKLFVFATAAIANVAFVWPLVITTLAGTVAAAVLELTSDTVRLLESAVGIPTVPVEAVAPASSLTAVGFRLSVSAGVVTVPLTATVTAEARPVVASEILPETGPAAALAAIRTEIVPEALPPLWVSEVTPLKETPFVETSNPVGATTEMLSDKLVPVTENVWAVEGLPTIELKAAKGVPVVLMMGVPAETTVKSVALVAVV
jgi:hypothetical protein